MKIDSEPVLCHSSLVHKSDPKPFEYNDYALDTVLPKSGNEIVKENQKVISYDLKGHDRDADQLSFEMDGEDRSWNTRGLDCPLNMDAMVNGCGNEVRNSVATCAISSEQSESFDKDGDMCMDETVTKHELPVCCKDSTDHVVKDICMDEGTLFPEKLLVESGKEEQEGFGTFMPLDTDKNVDSIMTADNELLLPDGQIASEANDCSKNDNNLCSLKDLMQAEERNYDARVKMTNSISEEKIVPEDIFFVSNLSKESSLPKLSESNGMEIEQQFVQNSSGGAILENAALVSAPEESDNKSFTSAAEKSDEDGSPDELGYKSNLESGTIIFDFASSNTSMGREREVSPQNVVCEPPPESQNTSKLEGRSDSLPFSGQIQKGLGESSFSAIGPPSALISYSGQIAHSGNISLRSDSSTTSTRSFAFPILQSEWNSSPVRMAKADRRHLRKHRGWRQGLLCCRF